MNTPAPLDREPRAVRPPFDVRDTTFDHLQLTDTAAWRTAVQLDRVAALREPLEGLAVSDYEHRMIEWLAGFDVPTVAAFVALLHRARAADPLAVPAQSGPVLVHQTGGRVHVLADNVLTECGRRARNLHGQADGRATGCPTCTAGLTDVTCKRCRERLAAGGAR